jgi:predicted ATPase
VTVSTISGSQGQGKSTVLNTLAGMNYNVVQQKTSRSILKEWGYTLNEVNRYPPLTRAFQDEVLSRHVKSIQPLLDSDERHFMERSFADIFVYANLAIGSFNEYNGFMEDYYGRCVEAQSMFHSIYHLTGRTFLPEDDGVRSTSRFFGATVDREILQCLRDMNSEIGANQLLSIALPDNLDRVHVILRDCCGVYHDR